MVLEASAPPLRLDLGEADPPARPIAGFYPPAPWAVFAVLAGYTALTVAKLLWKISPMNAGLAIQATTHLSGLPLSSWAGLGVLAVWAAAALLGGGLPLRLRDA